MKINEYIESGVLEAYVLGSASEAEINELLQYKTQYPEVEHALLALEEDLEQIYQHMAIAPPPGMWNKIEGSINELVASHNNEALKISAPDSGKKKHKKSSAGQFIEVEGASSHMRIHKLWRWIFGAVFLLGKIFLAFAIYFYLESRQAEQRIQKLEAELKQSGQAR